MNADLMVFYQSTNSIMKLGPVTKNLRQVIK